MLVYTSGMLEMLAFQCVYLNVCGDRFCSSRSHAMDTSLGIMYLSAHTHGMVKSGNFFTCELYEIACSRRLCSFEAVCCFQPVGLLALLIFFLHSMLCHISLEMLAAKYLCEGYVVYINRKPYACAEVGLNSFLLKILCCGLLCVN